MSVTSEMCSVGCTLLLLKTHHFSLPHCSYKRLEWYCCSSDLAVKALLGKRWCSCRCCYESTKSPSAFALCTVCLSCVPSCHLCFIGLWALVESHFSFSSWLRPAVGPRDTGSRFWGMLGDGEWHMPRACRRMWVMLQAWIMCLSLNKKQIENLKT